MKESTKIKLLSVPFLYMKKSILPAILLGVIAFGSAAFGQTMPEPQQEKLLNGLKVMVWNDPSDPKVTLKLRVHSGAIFDPKDKMGVMALLSEILFPDDQTRSYFQEELEGKLEVSSNYDYIQITATGKADEFTNILDTIRVGVVNTPITPENFTKVRDAQLQKVRAEANKPTVLADQAVARYLLGEYPYGRPAEGTAESLMRLDRFDLVTAKEKFLGADNATLAIYGKIDPRFAMRAARQMLGNWSKSDVVIPATFAQPYAPDTKTVLVNTPGEANAEIRFALRNVASNDKENAALMFWSSAFEKKLNAALPAECPGGVKIENKSHVLPALWMVRGTFPVENAAKCFNAIEAAIKKADSDKVNPADFTETQKTISSSVTGRRDLDHVSTLFLNADTFKWGKVSDQLKLLTASVPADGDKVATRIFWKAPFSAAIVGDAAKLKGQFADNEFALNNNQLVQMRKELTDFLLAWRSAMEKRDAEALMKMYAPRLEAFYEAKDQDQSYVRSARDKDFTTYDKIDVNLTKVVMVPDSENVASITWDKTWNFTGKEQTAAGSSQQELKLAKTNGMWHIVSEKDVKVYSNEVKKVAKPAATPDKQ